MQVPTIYNRRIGEVLVTTVCDGYIDVPIEALTNISPAESETLFANGFRPKRPRITVNSFLIRSAGRTALIDVGSGSTLGATLGWIPNNLNAAGIDLSKIDTVLLTHMHPDHSNGLLDASNAKTFSAAELLIHENEVAHWRNDERREGADARQRMYFDTARQCLAQYDDQLRTIRAGQVVFPGIEAIAVPGHTPGHTAYRITSGSESLLIWGDIVHVPEVQVSRPEVGVAFDTDATVAVATRRRILDIAATDKLLVAGMHIHFPGFSYVVRSGTTYSLVPEVYQLEV
jgi:glyoxylase-like metal-dependent hydrolase (beta-lactamase superfamily II)